MLSGELEDISGKSLDPVPKMKILSLRGNNLYGTLPKGYGKLENLEEM